MLRQRVYLYIYSIALGSHNKDILVQSTKHMAPPIEMSVDL